MGKVNSPLRPRNIGFMKDIDVPSDYFLPLQEYDNFSDNGSIKIENSKNGVKVHVSPNGIAFVDKSIRVGIIPKMVCIFSFII
jgi:hypothetical protein